MAHLLRVCVPGAPHHVIQRGNNRQVCFAAPGDFSAYAAWLRDFAEKYDVDLHAWVFMTNHVHLLARPKSTSGIPRMMQSLGRRYVRYFNDTYRRTGTLWEGRYKSCVVHAEQYLLACQRYIELNPVRAGMVTSPADYSWSSYQAHGPGKQIAMWRPHPIYLQLGPNGKARLAAYRELFRGQIDDKVVAAIRATTNKGLALGSDHFKQAIEELTGRRVSARKRGPNATER